MTRDELFTATTPTSDAYEREVKRLLRKVDEDALSDDGKGGSMITRKLYNWRIEHRYCVRCGDVAPNTTIQVDRVSVPACHSCAVIWRSRGDKTSRWWVK